jgi:hypothetical protein
MRTLEYMRGTRAFALATALAFLASTASAGLFALPALAAPGDVITQPATDITANNATLNGLTGPADASQSSFWVSTSTIDTSDPNVIPSGVYSTPDLGPVSSTTAFSANLTDAVGLPPVTPGTTYFYVAWVNTDEWTPGEEVSFTTLPDAPSVSSISPTSGPTTGGTEVTVEGSNFTGATSVNFGDSPAIFTVDDDSTITATSPAATSSGTVNVTVTTAGGTSATSSADEFTYEDPAPLAPVISNLQVSSTTSSGATITWNTNTPATTHLNYGTTTSYGSSSTFDPTLKTSHSVTLSGLEEITQYFVEASSGNVTATTTATTTFTTSSTASSTPLEHIDTEAIDTTGIANGEWEDGWEWVLTFTVPDNETQFQMRFTDWSSNGNEIPAAGNIRYFTEQSSSASTTASAIVIDEESEYADAITLTGDADSSTPGRQVEVRIQVKIPFGTPAGTYSTTFGVRTDTP